MIRLIYYTIISIFILIASYYYFPHISSNTSGVIKFSYIGTVATIIALFIAIMEILYSIKTSMTIHQHTLSAIEDVKKVQDASNYSDCLAAIDIVNNNLNDEKYETALNSYQHLRKVIVKITPNINEEYGDTPINLDYFNDIEYELMKANKTTPRSPLSKRQKNSIIKKLLLVKSYIEKINPAKGTN